MIMITDRIFQVLSLHLPDFKISFIIIYNQRAYTANNTITE